MGCLLGLNCSGEGVVGVLAWWAGPLWLTDYVAGLNFLAQGGCWDGVVRRGRAVRVSVAAMQFIKSQKERPRRYVTISRSPYLISDAARGAFTVGTPHCP